MSQILSLLPSMPERFDLSPDTVHLWSFPLDASRYPLDYLQQLLTYDERSRALRFYFERDRHRFIICRGVLRHLMSRYLGELPESISISYGPNGKPLINSLEIAFNVSHSHELGAIAFAKGRAIGVDIEKLVAKEQPLDIARRFFADAEYQQLVAMGEVLRDVTFFRCWTRKEAYVKARGDGLTFPLNRFQVSVLPDEKVRLLACQDEPDEVSRWTLQEIAPVPGYIGAVAVEGRGWLLECRSLFED